DTNKLQHNRKLFPDYHVPIPVFDPGKKQGKRSSRLREKKL
ncbi:unnamed protein product, partial [marine sediment metagenome]